MADVVLTLPGLKIHCDERAQREAQFLWHEIFNVEDYCQYGIRIEPGSAVVDVGANIGVFALFAADKVGESGAVLAIEALPDIFRLLTINTKDVSSIERVRAALGSFPQEGSIGSFRYYPLLPGNSSSARWKLELDDRMRRDPNSDAQVSRAYGEFETREIEFETLHALLSRKGWARKTIDLLKIDTEGSELDVLQGVADDTYRDIRQVVAEANHPDQASQIADFLRSRDYELIVAAPQWASTTDLPNRTVYARRG